MDIKKKRRPGKETLFYKTGKLLVTDKKHFFFYQLIYFILAFLVAEPVVLLFSKISKEYAGYSYVTEENFVDFLSMPVTIFSLIVIIVVLGILLLGEISLVLSFLMVGKKLENKNGIYIFWGSMKNLFRCLKPDNFTSVLLALSITVLSGGSIIYVSCTRGRITKYLLKSMKHTDVMVAILFMIVSALVLFVFLNYFSLPYFLLENKNMRESRQKSKKLTTDHLCYITISTVVWNILVFLFCGLIYIVVIAIEAIFVELFVDGNTSVAVFLTMYEHINLIAVPGLIWFCLYSNLGLFGELFITFKQRNDEEYNSVHAQMKHVFFVGEHKKMAACFIAVVLLVLECVFTYRNVSRGEYLFLEGINRVVITAHRGSSIDAPENTVPAIKAAITNKAEYAEIDVQETKDGEVIVLHDSNLKRTSGYNEFIWNVTFKEVRTLDMGGWFSDNYKNTQMPTLEEVIQVAQGRIKLNIEIKENSHFPDLEDKVVALIEKYNLVNRCVVQSTNYNSLVRVKKLNQKIKTGYILMAAYGNFQEKDDIDFFSIRSSFVNKRMVESAHKNGKEVYAWTVNTKNEIRRMKILKVDNIITDRPLLVRELLYKDDFDSSFINLFHLLKQ